ncbi:MAG: AMP-binding protein [Planctomycetaceae bacterium]|nr:AMP-binding protein [Planctomycetaceae bacterium]
MATAFSKAAAGGQIFAGNTEHAVSSTETASAESWPSGVPRHLEYPSVCAWGLLDRAARMAPGHLACHYNGSEWSWEELNLAARRAAGMLQRLGVTPGDRVGILLPNVPEYLIALNGIWRAGAIAVAISPLMVAEEVEQLLVSTRCRVVVCLDMLAGLLSCPVIGNSARPEKTLLVSLRPQLPLFEQLGYLYLRRRRTGHWWMETSDQVGWFWDEMHAAEPAHAGIESDPASTPAYILPTGGTTGTPRAVTLSHRNLVANAWQQAHWAGATIAQERLLGVLPFFHSYGLSTIGMGGAALAASLFLHHRFNARQVIRTIESHRITVFHAVPAMLLAMNEYLRKHPADLKSLKWVISGGAGLPEDVGHEFQKHSGALIVEGYGLSEASPVTHVGPLSDAARFGTIGLPLPDTGARIVDAETGQTDLPDGEIGELLVRGPQVMLGYWKDPAATALAIRNGWLFTGDLARRHPDGLFQIVERKKDLIITSGFNVYPREVEDVIRHFPGIRDAAVVGVPDAHRGEIVKAFVVTENGIAWDPEALDAYCKEHLSAHKRPRLIERCEHDLPRSFLGKVIRRHLRTMPAATHAVDSEESRLTPEEMEFGDEGIAVEEEGDRQ